MMAGFEALERDEQGYASVNGLFAIIGAMRQLPGRKSIVLFSEGVAIPPAVHRLFLGVIDAANRANVSIYTMDAAGLRPESEQAKIRDQVNQAGKRGLTSYASSPRRETTGNEPLTKALELNEDVLRQDPHTGLGELAQGTGGLIFDSTNNLRTGFDRVESDLRNYYLIGYTPTNPAYDGTFRKIEVKVKRPGLTVAARKRVFRRARYRWRACQYVGGPRACRARPPAGAERVPVSRRCAAVSQQRETRALCPSLSI